MGQSSGGGRDPYAGAKKGGGSNPTYSPNPPSRPPGGKGAPFAGGKTGGSSGGQWRDGADNGGSKNAPSSTRSVRGAVGADVLGWLAASALFFGLLAAL